MTKRKPPRRIPFDFETTVKALLQTTPPPAGTPGIRKVKAKGRTTKWRRLKQEFDAAHRRGMKALQTGDYATVEEAIAKEREILEEQAAIVDEGALPRPKRKARKRKSAKKR
jgi:hypothetical protein